MSSACAPPCARCCVLERMAKRLFDCVGAALALLLLSPFLLGLALWIVVDSPGPALYRQERAARFVN